MKGSEVAKDAVVWRGADKNDQRCQEESERLPAKSDS